MRCWKLGFKVLSILLCVLTFALATSGCTGGGGVGERFGGGSDGTGIGTRIQVAGVILDPQQQPVEGVRVEIPNGIEGDGDTTNDKGEFAISDEVREGESAVLQISSGVGNKGFQDTIDIPTDEVGKDESLNLYASITVDEDVGGVTDAEVTVIPHEPELEQEPEIVRDDEGDNQLSAPLPSPTPGTNSPRPQRPQNPNPPAEQPHDGGDDDSNSPIPPVEEQPEEAPVPIPEPELPAVEEPTESPQEEQLPPVEEATPAPTSSPTPTPGGETQENPEEPIDPEEGSGGPDDPEVPEGEEGGFGPGDPPSDPEPFCWIAEDVNCDGCVNQADLDEVTHPDNFGLSSNPEDDPHAANPLTDIDGNGMVTGLDAARVTNTAVWGTGPLCD